MVEILKQGQYAPLSAEKQIVIIYAGTQGLLDDVPIDAIRSFEEFLLPFVERRYKQIYGEIREKREISDALRQVLDTAVSEAKAGFVQTKGIKPA
jgi:F-type H+-transporting ATPase subunit alpha